MSNLQQVLKLDGENRDFIHSTAHSLSVLSDFLSTFDKHAKSQMAKLDSRLDSLERVFETLEARVGRSNK